MELRIEAGWAWWGGRRMRCAVGRAGARADKKEGDGATPAGTWRMRYLLCRPDRFPRPPPTGLPLRLLRPEDGWCDDPADPHYNRAVTLPYPGHAEALWRADAIYDLIVPLGYNDGEDAPIVTGAGSAIFIHVARPQFTPTEGCVALARGDLLTVLAEANTAATVRILA
jgi:L,D-peptidoglycan transpeptidase YkuD (ErfK/YbiS/YcfS/YnhG family)